MIPRLALSALLAFGLQLAVANEAASDDPRIGLALGSGGAAGLAHIAILRVFDEQGIRPVRIAGTSIGAIIGGLYAAGLSADEIEALFAEFGGSGLELIGNLASGENGVHLSDLLDLDLDDGGVVDPAAFLDYLRSKVDARRFSDLEIPMLMVATSYYEGKPVVIDEGDLFEAMRASMAVPGLFPPVERAGQVLVDGGISDPLPWGLLGDDLDYRIAVDVSGQRERPADGELPANELLFKTFELMQQSIIRARREADPPDLLLRPETEGIRLLHFHRVDEIIEQAGPAADRLTEFLTTHSSSSSSSSSQP